MKKLLISSIMIIFSQLAFAKELKISGNLARTEHSLKLTVRPDTSYKSPNKGTLVEILYQKNALRDSLADAMDKKIPAPYANEVVHPRISRSQEVIGASFIKARRNKLLVTRYYEPGAPIVKTVYAFYKKCATRTNYFTNGVVTKTQVLPQ